MNPAPVEADKELEELLGIFAGHVVNWSDGDINNGDYNKRYEQTKAAIQALVDKAVVAELKHLLTLQDLNNQIDQQYITDRLNQLKDGAKDEQ